MKRIYIVAAILCAIAIFMTCFSVMKMHGEIASLSQQVNDLQNNLSNTVNASVSGAVGGISASIDETLKKGNSIIADYSYHVEPDKFNRADRTIPVNFKVTPREYKDGLTAAFLIETKDGKTVTVPAAAGENGIYTAEAPLPIVDFFKLSVVFDDGTLKKSEKLEDVYGPFSGCLLSVNSSLERYTISSKHASKGRYTFALSGRVVTNITANPSGSEAGASTYPVSGELKILKNDKVLKKVPVSFEENGEIGVPPEGLNAYYDTAFETKIDCKPDDLLKLVITVTDNYGVTYTQTADQEKIDSDGNMIPIGNPEESIIE